MSELEEHTWDYRVVHRGATDAGLDFYAIRGVFFSEDGRIAMFDADPVFAVGDMLEKLAADLG